MPLRHVAYGVRCSRTIRVLHSLQSARRNATRHYESCLRSTSTLSSSPPQSRACSTGELRDVRTGPQRSKAWAAFDRKRLRTFDQPINSLPVALCLDRTLLLYNLATGDPYSCKGPEKGGQHNALFAKVVCSKSRSRSVSWIFAQFLTPPPPANPPPPPRMRAARPRHGALHRPYTAYARLHHRHRGAAWDPIGCHDCSADIIIVHVA